MCIICCGNYDINITMLNCSECKLITEIPKELVNLIELYCWDSQIEVIPKELVNLKQLHCSHTQVKEIPKELVNLTEIDCDYTNIKEIPKELVNLTFLHCPNTQIKEIPKELINFTYIYYDKDCIQDKSWLKSKQEVKKIIKFQKYWKKYGKFINKLPTLWKIAEYYTEKKYSPENILKYINLEDFN